jgi:hypothetical protein
LETPVIGPWLHETVTVGARLVRALTRRVSSVIAEDANQAFVNTLLNVFGVIPYCTVRRWLLRTGETGVLGPSCASRTGDAGVSATPLSTRTEQRGAGVALGFFTGHRNRGSVHPRLPRVHTSFGARCLVQIRQGRTKALVSGT